MDLLEYIYDRFIDSKPLILLPPLHNIIIEFLVDEFLIAITFFFCFVSLYFGLYYYRKIIYKVEDRETQTIKEKYDKETQTKNNYDYTQSIRHTLRRRLIVMEETLTDE